MPDKLDSEGKRYLEYLRGLVPDSAEYRLEADRLDFLLSQYPRLDFEEALAWERLRKRSASQRRRQRARQRAFDEFYVCHVQEAGNDRALSWSVFERVAEHEKQSEATGATFPEEFESLRIWLHDSDTDTKMPMVISKSEFYRLIKSARRSRWVKRKLGKE